MINLLPPEQKRAIAREYRSRLIIVASISVGIGTIIAGIFLVPSFVLLLTRKQAATENLASAKSTNEASGGKTIEEQAMALGAKISLLKNRPAQSPSSIVLKELSGARPSGITITNIRIASAKNGTYAITILGHAVDRRQLLLFTETLKQNAHFKEIDLPIDELVKNVDISYRITLTYRDQA